MTLSASKCHMLFAVYKNDLMFAKVADEIFLEEVSAILPGIIIIRHLQLMKKV